MKLTDFLFPGAFVPQLASDDKEGIIRELVEALVRARKAPRGGVSGIVDALLERERLGSTGIGKGIAVPHAKQRSVREVVGTVGLSPPGVDFAALDGELVYVFFLLVSPPNDSAGHLAALELIAQTLKHETFCRFLRQCRTEQELVELLEEADQGKYAL
jgi:PTS system fructose-specific IIA component/PTS system nitrogen regulatory IIA component